MKVYWKSWKQLSHIDNFSRYAEEPDPVLDYMAYTIWAPPNETLQSEFKLPTIEDFIQAQQSCVLPQGSRYVLKNGALYYLGRLLVPEGLRQNVLAACHILTSLHNPKVKKTEHIIKKAFNWPNIHDDFFNYVRSCLSCQRFGLGLFRTHPAPGPFHSVYVDFWSASYGGQQHSVLTMIDQHTKWAEAIPVPNHTKEVAHSSHHGSLDLEFLVLSYMMEKAHLFRRCSIDW